MDEIVLGMKVVDATGPVGRVVAVEQDASASTVMLTVLAGRNERLRLHVPLADVLAVEDGRVRIRHWLSEYVPVRGEGGHVDFWPGRRPGG